MKPPLAQMRKVLEAEQARGFQDSAVLGGLDRFLPRWLARWKGSLEPSLLQQGLRYLHLAAPGYARLSPEERRVWLTGALRWVGQCDGAPEGETIRNKVASQKESALSARGEALEEPALSLSKGQAAFSQQSQAVPPYGVSLDAPVSTLRGVDVRQSARLQRLGVTTVRDMLYILPRRHIDYSQVKPVAELEVGVEQTVVATVWSAGVQQWGRGLKGTEAVLGDETGNIRAVWYNNPWMARALQPNARVAISGKVSLFRGQKVFQSPDYELDSASETIHTRRLVPVYPLTQGLSERTMRRLVKGVVDYWAPRVEDFLPVEVRERAGLLPLGEALRCAHYPDNLDNADAARRRLAFDELLVLQLGLMARRRQWREERAAPVIGQGLDGMGAVRRFLDALPFSLTAAQERCWGEIRDDLGQSRPMSRLLQGEVGSGKTVVAAAGLVLCASTGHQGALMVPTEILADQHFRTLTRLLGQAASSVDEADNLASLVLPGAFRLRVARLKGSLGAKARQDIVQQVARGDVHIVVGTHALIQEDLEFHALGLVVVDEQHRFGVMQRQALRQKGASPHLLAMTATPIPRTLALTLYGDLDISVIDQLPPGRKPVKTKVLTGQDRGRAYDFIRKQVAAGYQAFVLCPLIEDSDAIQARAATEEYERLSRDVFSDLKLGLLHGRMSSADKEEAMARLSQGDLDVLVTTPVVEVGVDIPGASVILIESAERFGLAQLHQFRGRVGRGGQPGYCILMGEDPSPGAKERLYALERLQDGLALAEEDMRLRGIGDFLGTRQSGLPQLRLARLSDIPLLEMARREARRIFEEDPALQAAEHRLLGRELAVAWGSGITEV